jgi:hypothetical protein
MQKILTDVVLENTRFLKRKLPTFFYLGGKEKK